VTTQASCIARRAIEAGGTALRRPHAHELSELDQMDAVGGVIEVVEERRPGIAEEVAQADVGFVEDTVRIFVGPRPIDNAGESMTWLPSEISNTNLPKYETAKIPISSTAIPR
jgi:hypothetical protein